VVEKDASFQHVVGSNFIEATGPCIVATVRFAGCLTFIVDKADSIPLPYVARISLLNFLVINLLLLT